jgi:hypothetical protein
MYQPRDVEWSRTMTPRSTVNTAKIIESASDIHTFLWRRSRTNDEARLQEVGTANEWCVIP